MLMDQRWNSKQDDILLILGVPIVSFSL